VPQAFHHASAPALPELLSGFAEAGCRYDFDNPEYR
jgi:hypothetical protein